MLTFLSLSLNEADIAGDWIRHCWAQGADRVVVADAMSPDGTADILRANGAEIVEDHEPFCFQGRIMSDLAQTVTEGWVIPADMDEFWVPTDRAAVLSDVLDDLPETVGQCGALVWEHFDRDRRRPEPKHLPKIAFRATPGVKIAMGNHGVHGVPGARRNGLLEVREIPWRGRDHFKTKVRQRVATLDPDLAPGDATHYRELMNHTDAQLDECWDGLEQGETVWDPIPSFPPVDA